MSTPDIGLPGDKSPNDPFLEQSEVDAMSEAIQMLFAGIYEQDCAGSANVTPDEATAARYPILKLTGVLTGSIALILPAWTGKQWFILNATSGSFSVTVRTSGGTGPVITQGYGAAVRSDGTDIKRSAADVAGDEIRLVSPRIVTAILDSNGNELFKFTATASAVNEWTVTNGATGSGVIMEATGGDSNIDATVRGKGTGGVQVSRSGGKLAFFGATLQSRAAALTQTYSTADRTLSAYTSDPESGAYTGAADGEAKLADLNALRVAYENLRAFTEDLAGFVNALVDDLQAYGLEQ